MLVTNRVQGGGVYGGYEGYLGGYEGLGAYAGGNEIGGGEEHKEEEFIDYHVRKYFHNLYIYNHIDRSFDKIIQKQL